MPDSIGEPSPEATAAAEELRSFGDYILSNRDWRGSRGPSEAIASAARTRASQILTESGIENAQKEKLPTKEKDLAQALEVVLNRYSAENASGTPDYILAEFLLSVLRDYNVAIQKRAIWRGEPTDLFEEEAQPAPSKKSFFGKDRKF